MPQPMEITMIDEEPIDELEKEEEDAHETDEEEDQEDEPEEEVDEEDSEDEEETIVVTIGDDEVDEEETHEEAPDWVKKVRSDNRELKKTIKGYEAKEAEAIASKEKSELGDKPNRDDFDYGKEDEYDDALIAWNDRKKSHEDSKKTKAAKNAKYEEAYQAKEARYNTKKIDLPIDNFDDVEEKVKNKLTPQQYSCIIHLMEKPEILMLALGNNSKELERISAIEDPLKLSMELGRIEDKLKMTTRKKPSVHKPVGSGTGKKASSDNKLEQLRAKANKSGDMTEVIAYKREQKEKLRKAS